MGSFFSIPYHVHHVHHDVRVPAVAVLAPADGLVAEAVADGTVVEVAVEIVVDLPAAGTPDIACLDDAAPVVVQIVGLGAGIVVHATKETPFHQYVCPFLSLLRSNDTGNCVPAKFKVK